MGVVDVMSAMGVGHIVNVIIVVDIMWQVLRTYRLLCVMNEFDANGVMIRCGLVVIRVEKESESDLKVSVWSARVRD